MKDVLLQLICGFHPSEFLACSHTGESIRSENIGFRVAQRLVAVINSWPHKR